MRRRVDNTLVLRGEGQVSGCLCVDVWTTLVLRGERQVSGRLCVDMLVI